MRTVNVYEFDELSSEVQKKVIDRYRDSYVDIEDAMSLEFINYVGYLDLKLSYSLSCCQGDGVSFSGEVIGKEEVKELADYVYGGKVPRKILRLINWGIIIDVQFIRNNSHYVHKHTVDVIVEGLIPCHYYIYRAICDFEKAIKKWYLNTCNALETFGYNTIDSLRIDDYVRECIIANDLEFTENGDDLKGK